MKVIDVLRFNRELLEKIDQAGIRLEDVKYVDLYTEYSSMKSQGDKITYIVYFLSAKYGISERKVYNIIKKMQTDCMSGAVNRGGVNPY